METIINKVAESGIVTLDLAPFIPGDTIAAFDIRPFLFREMILREKDYRAALAEYDWQQFSGRHVAIYCTADAIVPVWAYMLDVDPLFFLHRTELPPALEIDPYTMLSQGDSLKFSLIQR